MSQVPALSSVHFSKHNEKFVSFAKPTPAALEITSQGISTSTSSGRQLKVAMSSCWTNYLFIAFVSERLLKQSSP